MFLRRQYRRHGEDPEGSPWTDKEAQQGMWAPPRHGQGSVTIPGDDKTTDWVCAKDSRHGEDPEGSPWTD